MASCSTALGACFSGRTAPQQSFVHVHSKNGGRAGPAPSRRPERCTAWRIRSSLEEEFKKQCLGLTNGTGSSSSNQQERLQDVGSAHAARLGDVGGKPAPAASSSSSSSSSLPPSPDNYDEAAAPPFLANLPLAPDSYHPLEFYPTSQIDLDWTTGGTASDDTTWLLGSQERGRCFVILFGVGRAETEGIYSLRAVAKDDGLPVDTIVAFENEDDALRYSTLLEATMDHEPTVWPIEWGELLEFCNSAGYRCRLEPAGSLLIPPDYNVGMTDWEKSLKLRKGEFNVLSTEPAPLAGGAADGLAGGLFIDGPEWVFESAPMMHEEDEVQAEHLNAVIDSQLSSPAALEAMRASLERLLPQE